MDWQPKEGYVNRAQYHKVDLDKQKQKNKDYKWKYKGEKWKPFD